MRLRVVTPEVRAVLELPYGDAQWPALPGVSIDMLDGATLFLGGAQRYPDDAWRVPVMGV